MGLLGGGSASSTSVSSSDETKSMTVYVCMGEENIQVEVQRGARVEHLKARTHEKKPGVAPARMHFKYKDTDMKDGQKLSEYGVKNRSRCQLTVQ